MYIEYQYYEEKYLLGKEPVIPGTEFAFWEKQARMIIDERTFDRIKKDEKLLSDKVRDCTCAIAEVLYRSEQITQNSVNQGVAGVMTSYSNDGQSASFDVSQSKYTESGKKAEINRLMKLYLWNTGLLYAGVHVCES